MGIVFWTFVVGIGAAGYFVFRKLSDLEKDIRRELMEGEERAAGGKKPASGSDKSVSHPVEERRSAEKPGEAVAVGEEQTEREEREAVSEDDVVGKVLSRVKESPGILQTELYELVQEENRRRLQDTLLQMDREGILRREREGSSYRLYAGGGDVHESS